MEKELEIGVRMLLDEKEIREVIYRRARATDHRDREMALGCYHPDGTEDHEGFDGPVSDYLGVASPVFMPDSPIEVNFHLVGNTEIEFDGDVALCRSAFMAALTVDEGGRRDYINAGRYIDTFTYESGRWLIHHRKCEYEWSRGDDATDRWWSRHKGAASVQS